MHVLKDFTGIIGFLLWSPSSRMGTHKPQPPHVCLSLHLDNNMLETTKPFCLVSLCLPLQTRVLVPLLVINTTSLDWRTSILATSTEGHVVVGSPWLVYLGIHVLTTPIMVLCLLALKDMNHCLMGWHIPLFVGLNTKIEISVRSCWQRLINPA
jgi:hypothetical protein